MRLNNKGFSLIEIMAVLVMTTIILVPLLSGLSDAYNANQRAQHRSNALSIAQGAVYALEKIDYTEYESLVDDTRGITDYIELNKDNCADFDNSSNEKVCDNIFSQIWNNEVYDQTTFRVFIFDYTLMESQYDHITESDVLPIEVSNKVVELYCPEGTCNFIATVDDNIVSLKRVIIWVQYYEDPDKAIILEGLLVDEEY